MTTEFTSGTVPALYRQVFDICSHNGEPVHRDVYKLLLNQCKISQEQSKVIWEMTGPAQGALTRTNLYKTLALAAWAQQGKVLNEKLLENPGGKEYPSPNIDEFNSIKNLVLQLNLKENPAVFGFSYGELVELDSIGVELVPEKKGLFLKHSEYGVASRRFGSKVTRRYNDFVALQELLLARFPYRLVPRLPPKKIVSDSHFLESRRRALHRWLTLVVRHPVMSHDALLSFFLTDAGPDVQHRMREIFRRAPDEFMTSDVAASAKTLLPHDQTEIANNREQIRTLVNIVGKLKALSEAAVEREALDGRDFGDWAAQLRQLIGTDVNMWRGLQVVAQEFDVVGEKLEANAAHEQSKVTEKLALVLDVLISHRDLCERLEKGLSHDHQQALSKMLSLKKRKIQGVIRGTDSESVEQLEVKMLAQETIISNIELRSDFSFYCVHMETHLVHAYLETLSSILANLVHSRTQSHSELARVWKNLQQYIPEKKELPTNGQY